MDQSSVKAITFHVLAAWYNNSTSQRGGERLLETHIRCSFYSRAWYGFNTHSNSWNSKVVELVFIRIKLSVSLVKTRNTP